MHIHFHGNRGRGELKGLGGLQLHRLLNDTFPCIDSCCGMDWNHSPVDSLKLKPIKVEWLDIGAAVRCWRPSIRFERRRRGSEGAWSSPDVPETRDAEREEAGITAALRAVTEMKPERSAAAALTLDPWNERRLAGLCRQKASGLLSEREQSGLYCHFLLSAALFCWWQLFSVPVQNLSGL